MTEDKVNHPRHYANSCSLECIKVMETIFGRRVVSLYCLCNAFKYMWRFKNKNGHEDLMKAAWYVDYADPATFRYKEIKNLLTDLLNNEEKE